MAKKKTKKSSCNKLLLLVASVLGLLTSIALFLNVWVWKISAKSGETVSNVGGYFEDMEAYETAFKLGQENFNTWGATVAGICVIVALVAAGLLTLVTILNMLNKSSKTTKLVGKIACFIMLLAGLGALIGSLAFTIPSVGSTITSSMTMAFGAIAGFMFPLLSGTVGILAYRK